jgi:cell division protein FtsB
VAIVWDDDDENLEYLRVENEELKAENTELRECLSDLGYDADELLEKGRECNCENCTCGR